MALPDIGKFIKYDPQRFVIGSLANQIKTLIQRMKMRGYKPWKILLSPGLRHAFRLEMERSAAAREYVRNDLQDSFMGLPIIIDTTVSEPIIMINPEDRVWTLEDAQSTPDEVLWNSKKGRRNPNAVYQPKWRPKRAGIDQGTEIPFRSELRRP